MLAALLFAFQADPDALVRRLRSDDVAERDRATAALLELGESAGPALAGSLDDPDPEVRERARRIIIEGRIVTGLLAVAMDPDAPGRAAAAAAFHAIHPEMTAAVRLDLLDSTLDRGLTFEQVRDDFIRFGHPLAVMPGIDIPEGAAPAGRYREMLAHFGEVRHLDGGVVIGSAASVCEALLLGDDDVSVALLACTLDERLAAAFAAREDARSARVMLAYWARGGAATPAVNPKLVDRIVAEIREGPWNRRAAAAQALARAPRIVETDDAETSYLLAWAAAESGVPTQPAAALTALMKSKAAVMREFGMRAAVRTAPEDAFDAASALSVAAAMGPDRWPLDLLRDRDGAALGRQVAADFTHEDPDRRELAWLVADAFEDAAARDDVCAAIPATARAVDVLEAYGDHAAVRDAAARLFGAAARETALECAALLLARWPDDAPAIFASALSHERAAVRERAIPLVASVEALESRAASEPEEDLAAAMRVRAAKLRRGAEPPDLKRRPAPRREPRAEPEFREFERFWTAGVPIRIVRP